MLDLKIIRTYTDKSVTHGMLMVDGRLIGHTMEQPQGGGTFGKCIENGCYAGKIVYTEYSPFTIKLKHCGRRADACIIPRGEYECITEGICIGRRGKNERYALHDCDKVFGALTKAIQQHICQGDRKISVTIKDDDFIEKTSKWRKIVDETEDEDFFDDEEWN